jgi:hypothetical protein
LVYQIGFSVDRFFEAVNDFREQIDFRAALSTHSRAGQRKLKLYDLVAIC